MRRVHPLCDARKSSSRCPVPYGGPYAYLKLKANSQRLIASSLAGRAGTLPTVGKTLLALFHMERAFINDSMFSRLK
jgi:hypothetical protein